MKFACPHCDQKIEGGVSLEDSDGGSSAAKVLTSEQGKKYKLGAKPWRLILA